MKKIMVGLVAILVIALGVLYFTKTNHTFGNSAPDVQNTVYSGIVAPQIFLGNTTAAGSIGSIASTGSCNAGSYAASSTLFAVANPFAATSTVTLQVISGTGQATTTSLAVGTSTTATGVATTIGGTLANISAGTTTPFWTSGGVTVGSAGYVSAGANTFRTIVVGPNDFVVAVGTSTATGAGAANYSPGLSCAYKMEWKN